LIRRTFIFWAFEFGATTALAVLLTLSLDYIYIAIPILGLLVLKYLEFRITISDMYAGVRNQLDLLLNLWPERPPSLRCTLYVPGFGRRRLKQAFDYIQMGQGYGAGRTYRVAQGIIGKAYRQKGPQVENFASDTDYRRRMVKEYGYTEQEMRKRTADRRSYLCYPIVRDDCDEVIALLYFDSDTPGTFSLDGEDKLVDIIRCALNSIKANLK